MKISSLTFIAFQLLLSLLLAGIPGMGFAGQPDEGILIKENSLCITSPGGSGFTWFYDEEPLAGENKESIVPKESGTFTVHYTDEAGRQEKESITIIVSEDGRIIRIFTIGDSTVQDYEARWYPRAGWGQVLQSFFDPAGVSVINRAVGGTSSKSFYDSYWPAVKGELQAGDYVFIQFGINDRASEAYRRAMGEDFKNYLRSYVNESKAIGAIPVLVSTVRRDNWNADGTMYNNYHEHPQMVRDVAAEMDVPLVDLDTKSKAMMEGLGEAYTGRYFYNIYEAGDYPNYPNGSNDDVHFQEMGAIEMAKIVVEELQELESDENISRLIPHIKPQYEVMVSPNKPDVGITTRATTYPAGLTITLKAIPAAGHTFLYWKDEEGNLISNNLIHQFTMSNESRRIVGYFDDEETENDCNGDMGGRAKYDNCGVCAGGNSNVIPCTASVQAETVCIDGGVESATEGFMGTGYARAKKETGASMVWFMDGAGEEEFGLSIRYSNNSGNDIKAQLMLNDEEVTEINFPATGGAGNWAAVSPNLSIKRGSNTFKLVALSEAGLPDIDLFSWGVDFVRQGKGTCPSFITALNLNESGTGIRVFPNPFSELLVLEAKEPFQYKIYDVSGKVQAAGSCRGRCEIKSDLAPGFYHLVITTGKGNYTTKILKK